MSEMVERVARAIAASDEATPPIACACSGKESPEDFACPCTMYASRRRARAAIEAMREPTDAMLDGGRAKMNWGPNGVDEVWEAMVSSAISQTLGEK